MPTLNVACAVEGSRYVAHCATMLRSLLVQHRAHVHLFHGPDLSPRQRSRVDSMVRRDGGQITFHHVPDTDLAGLPTKGFTRKATWYRIFLPELLPELERVLYLDSDLLVVDDLEPLWGMTLGDNHLAAVTNVLEPMYSDRPIELGIAEGQAYFNAGVMLMDLAVMRRERYTRRLLDFGVREAHNLLWRDQDALNVVLGERRLALHPRWNSMNIFRFPWAGEVFDGQVLAEAIANPAIRHFEGPEHNKAWHFGAEPAHRELYRRHRRATPWPYYRPEGMTARRIAGRARRRLQALRS